MSNRVSVAPSAKRLTNSLRDIGYSFESAVADLIDNSITAGATAIDVKIDFAGRDSTLVIADNGVGMGAEQINEAMRFGSRRDYDPGELGRYGLGLKTASLSQCKRLEVVSRQEDSSLPQGRAFDLDFIRYMDDWITLDTTGEPSTEELGQYLRGEHGTVILWRKLDRILPSKSPDGGWARRRIEGLAPRLVSHLSMVFHRFLENHAEQHICLSVNGEVVAPWDPFCVDEPATRQLETDEFEVENGDDTGSVRLQRYILPSRERFSSREAFERASGPEKWNKQQGLYIYRADRLVQWSGWAGIRTIDEHTKLARASLDFETGLDAAFNINVAKMRVTVPPQLKKMMARPVNELCIEANALYRRSLVRPSSKQEELPDSSLDFGNAENGANIGLAIKSAAVRTGNYDALKQITTLIKKEMPELAKHLTF